MINKEFSIQKIINEYEFAKEQSFNNISIAIYLEGGDRKDIFEQNGLLYSDDGVGYDPEDIAEIADKVVNSIDVEIESIEIE